MERRLAGKSVGARMARTAWMVGVVGLAGCGAIEPIVPDNEIVTDPVRLYMALTLDSRALTLSTAPGYNTWQLTATPRNALGEPMVGLPAPTFRSMDTAAVHVTESGLLTARNPGTLVQIIAELGVAGNLRHVDTALVNVTTLTSPPTIASLSIQRVAPDSARLPVRYLSQGPFSLDPNFAYITPRVVDGSGGEITGLVYEYASLDPTLATVIRATNDGSGWVTPLNLGKVKIVARTVAYGVVAADTVEFTLTPPSSANIVIQSDPGGASIFAPTEVTLRTYGIVFWSTTVGSTVDVIFDDPTNVTQAPARVCDLFLPVVFGEFVITDHWDLGPHCGTGNVTVPPDPAQPPPGGLLDDPNTKRTTIRVRQFPVPGTYTYHTTTGATGRIVVTGVEAP